MSEPTQFDPTGNPPPLTPETFGTHPPPPMPFVGNVLPRRPGHLIQLAIFFVLLVWAALATSLASHAARGIVVRFQWSDGYPLVEAAFLVFLLTSGFSVLNGVTEGTLNAGQQAISSAAQATNSATVPNRPTRRRALTGRSSFREIVALPKRPSARHEWLTGAAIGWGIVVLAILPMALAGKLHIRLWAEPEAFALAAINLAAVLLLALASEIAFRGAPYRRLIAAVGPFWATIVLSLLYGWVVTGWVIPLQLNPFQPSGFAPNGWPAGGLLPSGILTAGLLLNGPVSHAATAISILLGLVLCWAWLRTRALWLGWGLHFAWIAILGILFGLPVLGLDNLSTVVESRAVGVEWLTGGIFGPEGAALTLLLLLASLIVLARATRDWAWHYTHTPIVAAGYPMDVPPPAAHTQMEQQSPRPPALIQILPTTPQTRSAHDSWPNP